MKKLKNKIISMMQTFSLFFPRNCENTNDCCSLPLDTILITLLAWVLGAIMSKIIHIQVWFIHSFLRFISSFCPLLMFFIEFRKSTLPAKPNQLYATSFSSINFSRHSSTLQISQTNCIAPKIQKLLQKFHLFLIPYSYGLLLLTIYILLICH